MALSVRMSQLVLVELDSDEEDEGPEGEGGEGAGQVEAVKVGVEAVSQELVGLIELYETSKLPPSWSVR